MTDNHPRYYPANATFEKVLEDGLQQIEDGEGFEYIVGYLPQGKVKVILEPEQEHAAPVIDGYFLVSENK